MENFDQFTTEQLQQAVRLMVRPEWLLERAVLEAVLTALEYNGEDVKEVLESGQPLHEDLQIPL